MAWDALKALTDHASHDQTAQGILKMPILHLHPRPKTTCSIELRLSTLKKQTNLTLIGCALNHVTRR